MMLEPRNYETIVSQDRDERPTAQQYMDRKVQKMLEYSPNDSPAINSQGGVVLQKSGNNKLRFLPVRTNSRIKGH